MDYVTDMAAKRAELTPDRAAFHDLVSGRTWSFADVERAASALALALSGRGLGGGARVAILTHNRPEFFVVLFACLKSDTILVPLNWRQPAPELAPVVAATGCQVLIHDATFTELANELAGEMGIETMPLEALIGDPIEAVARGSFGPRRRRTGDAWYLLHTSGTTGQPKAVIQTFGMAWANALNIGQAIDLVSGDSTLNYLPLFHTAGINLYTLPVFLAGGTSHVARKCEAEAALELIGAGRLSVFFGVPAIYQAISLDPRFAATDLSGVRSWGCGGAPLPEHLVRLYAGRGARICNGFGMTETGPTVFLMDKDHVEEKIGSVGKAQMLAEVRIVDTTGAVVTDGSAGELQIRGPGVTPGYFGNPAATESAFAEDGWLRTGDVARSDAEGYFYIVDRIKDMYISGGENVYPTEVERVLMAHPDILEASVIGVSDAKWGEAGAAFLLARPGRRITVDGLPGWCRERLAGYKIPKRFHVVDDFPRTAAGKIRKHLLKEIADA